MSLTKAQIKFVKSLASKKGRSNEGCFVVEGRKSVLDFLASKNFKLKMLFTRDSDFDMGQLPSGFKGLQIINSKELERISSYKNPDDHIAVFYLPEKGELIHDGLILALEKINDPGNLGTIIRLADWFGVKQIWCSKDTVDCFNPKVVQSSMGSLSRVSLVYVDLLSALDTTDLCVYATAMHGEVLSDVQLSTKNAVLVMGNEANGISEQVFSKANKKITIASPSVSQAESLNVAMATGICLYEFTK